VEQIVADLAVLQANGQLELLRQPAVLDDLRLNDEQRKHVKVLAGRLEEEWKQRFRFGRDPVPPDEARQEALKQAKANDEEVRKILSDEQLQRLPQIALQQQRTGAFREADVAAALKLTSKQRQAIRTIDEKLWFAAMKGWRGPGGPNVDPIAIANEQKRRDEAMDDILKLLTPEQNRQWKEMTGEPFKGPAPLFPFPRFFPGGPPPGGGFGGEPKGPPSQPGPH
jgi:hypothetical protein